MPVHSNLGENRLKSVLESIPDEQVRNHTVEEIGAGPASQIQEKLIEVIQLILQERISKSIVIRKNSSK